MIHFNEERWTRTSMNPPRRCFPFVELMVVVTVMVMMIFMAIPQLTRVITRRKESVLRNNLSTIRVGVDNYCYDKGKCPQNLEDLVTEGYLRAIPADPMNDYSIDWKRVMEDASQSIGPREPGIWDVHSGSDKTSLEGTPYSEW
jgi:general secretion pathway protein G